MPGKRIVGTALLMVFVLSCMANTFRYMHINSGMGLPHQQVEALMQDAKGNMWIGTRNGLSRYDGYTLDNYYHVQDDSTSLPSNFIFSLFLDERDNLWVGSNNGVSRYNPATNSFRNYTNISNVHSIVQQPGGYIIAGGESLMYYDPVSDSFKALPTLNQGFILSLVTDRNGRLFVATNNDIFYYNRQLNNINRLNRSLYEDFITGIDGIIPMCLDSKQNLWVSRNGKGVMKLDPTGSTILQTFDASSLSNGIVRCIREDNRGRIWLGTEKGITIINPDNTTRIISHELQNSNSLSDNAIYCFCLDNQENMWVGSYFGGVDVLLSPDSPCHILLPGNNPGELRGKVVRMMAETSPDMFWIATEDAGISIYDRRKQTFQSFTSLPAMGTNIHSLYYDKEQNEMWIGTFRNGLFRYNLKTRKSKRYLLSNGLASDAIFYLARQKSGRLWVATTQGLRYYDAASDQFISPDESILSHTFTYTLSVDNADNLWIGTTTKGIYSIDGKTQKINHYDSSPSTGLRDNYITALCRDSEGVLWIGTNNSGLQFMQRDGKIMSLGKEQLLSKITICGICESADGRLWISTSQGLFYKKKGKSGFKRITTEHGLFTNQFNFSSTLLASDGHLLLGSVNGLVELSPDAMSFNPQSLTVHLKRLLINNQEMTASHSSSPLTLDIDDTEVIKLSYDQSRSFTIEYGVIMPTGNSMVEYQTYLEGADKEWHNAGKALRFVGLDLSPGTYTLHVRASSTGENWQECPEKILRIVILPPLWRTWWAYLFYLLIVVAIIWICYRTMKERQEGRQAVRLANMEKHKIEELDKAKFDFFTTVSHELRTPLSLIVAPLKSISRENLDNDSSHNLDIAIKNTTKMEELISELVTFNKVETDSFQFYIQKGNPLEFIQLATEQFREAAEKQQIQLITDLENNGEQVWFSPSYVERIFYNLMSNALKFTQAGGRIIIKAEIELAVPNGGSEPLLLLRLSVSDTGIGIVREELPHIFDHYYQTKRGYNVNNKGWGIGLSLVKRLTEIHKGEVKVESEIGKGTTFTITLCVDQREFDDSCRIVDDKELVSVKQYSFSSPSAYTIDGSGDEQVAVSPQHDINILIVEDNTDLLDFLVKSYSSKFIIHTASNGLEALDMAHKYSIQLVISDVMMPKMNGYELCRKLKNDETTSHIPVILLTAKTEDEDAVMGYQCGAEAYVKKPFDPIALELQINNIISLRRMQQETIANSSDSDIKDAITQAELSPYDKQFMLKLNDLIERNIHDSDFSVTKVTEELGISRTLLHVKMRSIVNMSMGDYIAKKRMQLAGELLKQGYSVSDTAYRTGYSDPSYFSRVFKKHYGITASEYSKRG